jgi:hypothetical protein
VSQVLQTGVMQAGLQTSQTGAQVGAQVLQWPAKTPRNRSKNETWQHESHDTAGAGAHVSHPQPGCPSSEAVKSTKAAFISRLPPYGRADREGMECGFRTVRLASQKTIDRLGAVAPAITCHRWSKESTQTAERITGFSIFSQVGQGVRPRLRRTWPSERFPRLAG